MHSTLQEIRLVQRSLKSSCRYCSARHQSPRRAFHRTSTLQSSQEPGAGAGSSPAASTGQGKDGSERKSAIAHDNAAHTPAALPVAPPPLSQHGSGQTESDQSPANAFYGSSFNRRQRVRAQQEPSDPPFTTPQWFVDNNVTLWSEPIRDNGLIERTDEWNFDGLEARGGTAGGSSSSGRSPPADAGEVEPTRYSRAGLEAGHVDTIVPNPGAGSSDNDPAPKQSAPEPRYFIGSTQWDEISTTVRGLLNTSTSNTQYQTEPAVRANNLLLHYAGKDGEYFLDEVVRQLAAESGSNIVELDVQDIADLVSRARARDPSAAEGRMLSYDLLKTPEITLNDYLKDNSGEGVDEDDMEAFGIPFPGGGSNPPMLIGKPFTIDLSNLDRLFGSGGSKSSRRGVGSASISTSIPRLQQSGQGFRLLSPPSGPFYNVAESMLSIISEKEQRLLSDREEEDQLRSQWTEKNGLPTKSTIIHVKDIKAIQNTTVGGQFLTDFYAAVEYRRNQGENIVIVGTECGKETPENPFKAIESKQQTPQPAEISRTIVIAPIIPNQHFQNNLSEDYRRRTATINLRHIWEMMSVWEINRSQSDEPFLGLEPGFWKRNVYDDLSIHDQRRLNKQVWSFQYVHRVVSYLRGLSNYSEFASVDDEAKSEEQNKIIPVINAVAKRLSMSDGGKVAWAEHQKKGPSDSFQARNPKTAKRMEEHSKISKIRDSATKHEKRLLNGVIEPGKINTTFDDVHAPTETIEALQTLTMLSMINPEAFSYGVLASDRIPGLLLYGPPGTGKTLLAKAVAKESGATMLEVSAADLNDMYVGEGEKNVKALFSLAKKLSPCVVFLDEADAMFSARSAAGRRVSHRELLNQFLKEWDGMSNDAGSAFLMVATNRPMDFDDAVLRRLPRRLLIDLPTENDRHEILKIHLKAEQLAEDVNLADLAKRTPFYSGSDLKNLCVAAALTAVREQVAAKKAAAQQSTAAADIVQPETVREDNADADANAAATADANTPTSSPTMPVSEQDRVLAPTTATSRKNNTLNHNRRILTPSHFTKALEEITASVSEDMNSLKEIKKFDDVYGDRRGGRKRKVPKWGFRGLKEGVKGEGHEHHGGGGDTAKVRE